jgi:hypothetical protein
MNRGKKKILIFIISYKASFRVLEVYQKIPFIELKNFFVKVLLSDDFSNDDTISYIKKIENNNNNVYVNENKKNLGYGAHIKRCLNFAIRKKFNYAIMIHGDGQYNPKYIPALLKVFKKNVAAVTGSRILKGVQSVKKGGMPFYKLVGNVLLTKFFNILMNKNYTDTHTGLWAYNLSLLRNKKFNLLTNSFNFDQEFRFLNIYRKRIIKEIPIQTKYGDERSQLHIKYAIKFFFNSVLFFLIKNNMLKLKKFS